MKRYIHNSASDSYRATVIVDKIDNVDRCRNCIDAMIDDFPNVEWVMDNDAQGFTVRAISDEDLNQFIDALDSALMHKYIAHNWVK